MAWAETFSLLSGKLQAALLRLKFVEDGKPKKWVYGASLFSLMLVLVILGAIFPKIAANIATMGFDKVIKLIGALGI